MSEWYPVVMDLVLLTNVWLLGWYANLLSQRIDIASERIDTASKRIDLLAGAAGQQGDGTPK